jgi:excisionase family DNA binding protein
MLAEDLDFLTKAEAAEKLRVSPSTVDRLRAQGEIAWVPVGRQIRFRAEALADYVKRSERRVASEPVEPAPRARVLRAPAPGVGTTLHRAFAVIQVKSFTSSR